MLKEGSKAPDFTLNDKDGKEISLKDFKNQWVVVYFYPKADTPGCTTQAIDFTANIDTFAANQATILGISNDPEAKLGKFIDKHNLKIILLSDPDHKVIEEYGAWVLKKMYGREYMGTQRSTFLINPEGIIEKVWAKVKVKGHVEEVKNLLLDLKLD
ncbi:MAG: thioredoxin-dependent thiol peroxidase [Candidatus Heimdallarchaeota archaeon]|nr:thioredoxin-dependent thiol peroxidase [Candidatus Heimdallarchaeota archaeon]